MIDSTHRLILTFDETKILTDHALNGRYVDLAFGRDVALNGVPANKWAYEIVAKMRGEELK